MKNTKIQLRIEYFLVRFSLWTIPALSRCSVLRLAHFLGTIGYCGARHLRNVGLANLQLAYGDKLSKKEKKRILKKSFCAFALVMLDTFWFSKNTRERIKRYVRFEPNAFIDLFQSRAQICVTAHLGNWEVLGMAFSMEGYPLASVAAPLANPAVDQMFNSLRVLTGQLVYSKHGVVRQLLKTLRNKGKVALVLDQNTKPSEGGIFVNFFKLPVPVSSAAALLAMHTKAEVYVGSCQLQPDGSYFVQAPVKIDIPLNTPNEKEALHQITQSLSTAIENMVRNSPEQWLWMYKRWKYVAPGLPRAAYPFYAKEVR